MHRFQLELADIDRGVYESLDLRVARHPSEGEERMLLRVLARAVAHEPGLEFGRGLSAVEDPTLWRHSATGEIELWIDVGMPSADRLHQASKRAAKVCVFTDKGEAALRKAWSSRRVHRAEEIELVFVPTSLVRDLAEALERSVTWYLTVQDGLVSVAQGDRNFEGALRRSTLAEFLAAK